MSTYARQLTIRKYTSENTLKKKTAIQGSFRAYIKSRLSHSRNANHKKYKFHIPVKQARVAIC